MTISNLAGRFGNQLFQIAAGLTHSTKMGEPLLFNFSGELARYEQLENVYRFQYWPTKDAYRDIRTHYEEPSWGYSPIPATPALWLSGYFQSDKHMMRKDLMIAALKGLLHLSFNETAPKYDLVAHIRLGDYLALKDIHFVCREQYWRNALEHLKLPKESSVCVVTDGAYNLDAIEWIGTMWDDYFTTRPVVRCGLNYWDDLCIMRKAKSLIISNSTFSWWASYFGDGYENLIAPDRWFGPSGPQDFQDIYRQDMTLIGVT